MAKMDDFITKYLEWIKHNSSQTVIGDYSEISTPFVDAHNDQIQFYITRTSNGYMLTDDGYVINDLEMCGCDLKSKKRKQMMVQIAESIGVTIKDNCIVVEANESDIARKQHIMIQAILKISDMFLTTSSRVKGLFMEEVQEFFVANDIRNTPSIMLMGHSGLSHQFDFIIPASRKMPERVITTINTPTKQAVESALFAWNDVAKTRKGGNGSQGYIILNDKKKKPNTELFNAIQNYDLKAVPWTERDTYISEFAS